MHPHHAHRGKLMQTCYRNTAAAAMSRLLCAGKCHCDSIVRLPYMYRSWWFLTSTINTALLEHWLEWVNHERCNSFNRARFTALPCRFNLYNESYFGCFGRWTVILYVCSSLLKWVEMNRGMATIVLKESYLSEKVLWQLDGSWWMLGTICFLQVYSI